MMKATSWGRGSLSHLDGPAIRSANQGDSRESIRRKMPILIMFERFARIASSLRFATLVPRNAIRKKGIQFGNPETTRANQVICANLRIDSRKLSEQLPCRSAEVKIFSVFLCQRCREIWCEILVKFTALRFPGFRCATENFTKISRQKRWEKKENFTQISLCRGAALSKSGHLRSRRDRILLTPPLPCTTRAVLTIVSQLRNAYLDAHTHRERGPPP